MNRVGILGLGLMGQRMLAQLQKHPEFVVTQLFDTDIDTCTSVAIESQLRASSAEDLIHATDVDVVYVASPPHTHVPYALQAIAAQKHLFCEKPLAVDIAAAEQLVAVAEQSDLCCAVNFPFATLTGIDDIERELICGEPQRIDIRLRFSQWPRSWHTAGPWLSERSEGGFCREVFSHFAYLSDRILGSSGEWHLQQRELTWGESSESRVRASWEVTGIEKPVDITLDAAISPAPDHNEWTLVTAQHCYRLRDWSLLMRSTAADWTEHPWDMQCTKPQATTSGQRQLDALAHSLRGKPHPLPTLRQGLRVQRIVETLLKGS